MFHVVGVACLEPLAMSKLQIKLFGQLEITQMGAAHPLQLTGGCQRLLAYLLLNKGRMCRREVLMDIFWGENSPERARSCLTSALWRLRRELDGYGSPGAKYLLCMDSGEIGFNWECEHTLDVRTFEDSLSPTLQKKIVDLSPEDAALIERQLVLYRGELLEGIYDDWALIERERLRTLHIKALAQAMNYYANRRGFDKSLEFAKTILAQDPLREDVHRMVMRLYAANGQRALAVQQYYTCAMLLKSDLGIPPMQETYQLYQAIATSASTVPVNAPASSQPQNLERYLQSIARDLARAHNHLKQASQILTRLSSLNVNGHGELCALGTESDQAVEH
jgi:DNA-binding SARP family transcriptional activator